MKDTLPTHSITFHPDPGKCGNLNISLGCEKNGAMILNYQDTSELDQDSR